MLLNKLEDKIVSLEDLSILQKEFKRENKKTVFTNGCFDLIHLGHIDYLRKARNLGDVLIVGVNSDDSVKRLEKGASRPIKDEHQRAIILAAFHFVDYVVPFDDDTPLNLINSIKPSVLVKGGDYSPNETNPEKKNYIVGSKETLLLGNEVKVIPFVVGYSTSKLENKIIEANR